MICVAMGTHGMTDPGEAPKFYLDSNVFIYALNGPSDVAAQLQKLFGIFQTKPSMAVTSELTLAEILPRATSFQTRYYLNLIVWNHIFDLRPVSRDILTDTVDYRKAAGMPKLPDAIHVVTAIQAGCARILSNDRRLKLPDGYSVVHPDCESLSSLIRALS